MEKMLEQNNKKFYKKNFVHSKKKFNFYNFCEFEGTKKRKVTSLKMCLFENI